MDISQLGASGAVVLTVLLFLKYMKEEGIKREETINKLTISVDKNTEASKKQVEASLKQMEASKKTRDASHEVLVFMKKLNGKLENATIQKVQEQNVAHQVVENQEVIDS